jgi:hypothetical protein
VPDYIIFAPFDDCFANRLKAADLYDYYPKCDVKLTYTGEKELIGWNIYYESGELVAVLGPNELFAPTVHGKYYAEPIFANISNI